MTTRQVLGDTAVIEWKILIYRSDRRVPAYDAVQMMLKLEEYCGNNGPGSLRKKVAQWRKKRRYQNRGR